MQYDTYTAEKSIRGDSIMEGISFPLEVFVHEIWKEYTLQYNQDGSFIFRVNDQVDATSFYTIHDNLYTESTEYLPCSQAREATYTWTFVGQRLTFHLIGEDNCIARKQSLDGVTWIKH
jgi:hypothetical protein